jgi:transcriptional regulator with XRE-family HTH domain
MSPNISQARQVSVDDLSVATRIRQIRQESGLSQTEVAEALGISFQQFQKYEQGRNRISAARLVAIARILGVTPHDILHWTGEPTASPLIDPKCATVDRKVASLWHRIQSDRYRRAIMFLMETIDCEHGLHLGVGDKSQNQSSEVEK